MFRVESFHDGHPNPIFYRSEYQILNGEWDFAFDPKDQFEKIKGYLPKDLKINVPFSYLTKMSLINDQKRCDHVWYHRTLEIKDLSKRFLLHFEGADYHLKLWINDKFVGEDHGGYHRMTFDITESLHLGINDITVKCDDSFSILQPRGKQRFRKKNFACWYEETTGIWKTVWLETVNKTYIERFKITPDLRKKMVMFEFVLSSPSNYLDIEIKYDGETIRKETVDASHTFIQSKIFINDEDIQKWDVLSPKLYDLVFTLKDGDTEDKVFSYFGFRSLEIISNKVYLNDHHLYQKLVLDQGYFEGSDLTPPSGTALFDDISRMIDMGFNGVRKHQKREDDRFYAYADMMGYLVWAEMPSVYYFNKKSEVNVEREWNMMVKELYNHPSIIAWTPFNESWGIPFIYRSKKEQTFVNRIYHETKEYDPYRFVITNDGWCHTISDLLTIHLYDQDAIKLRQNMDDAINKGVIHSMMMQHTFAKGYHFNHQPILLTEFGGTAYTHHDSSSWGYGSTVKDDNEYISRLKSLFQAIKDDPEIDGYCYTQLSDVKQEINGLYTLDRKAKIKPEIMKDIQK